MKRRAGVCLFIATVFVVLSGCTAKFYKKWADKETTDIVEKKARAVPGLETSFYEGEFSIEEEEETDPLAGVPRRYQPILPDDGITTGVETVREQTAPTLYGGEESTSPTIRAETVAQETSPTLRVEEEETSPPMPAVLDLEKALQVAVTNSREYQAQEENIYLQALSLSLARYRYTPKFKWLLGALWRREAVEEAGEDGDTSLDYQRSVAYTSDLSFNQLLADGGSIAIGLSTDFFRYVSDDPQETAASVLQAEIIQPLLRGAGRKVNQENLTQSERDMVYELRDFSRFRKTFAVRITNNYYRVLEERAIIRNEWNNYQRLKENVQRAELMAQAGEMPEFQVDQARQDELRARERWIGAMQSYEETLDEFKIDLGLPTDEEVELDENELDELMERGIEHPEITEQTAVQRALKDRLDLLTAQDRVDDAERKVDVAKNDFLPQADLAFTYGVGTNPPEDYYQFQWEKDRYSVGLDVDLPLDRKAERNAYCSALINEARSRRNATLKEDRIKQEVRQAWRNLQRVRESYEIQKMSLELAEKRVESVSLLLQAGRASTRDLLETQEALVNAQNALVRALVDHTIARLQLLRDMETLTITDNGLWEELSNGTSTEHPAH